MVNMKGNPVNLGDLFGFSKLQDVLTLIIENQNSQDAAMQELRSELDGAVNRLDGQDAIVDQVRAESVASCKAVDECVVAQAALKLTQDTMGQKLEARIVPLEQKMLDSAKTLKELEALLQAQLQASQAWQIEADGRLKALQAWQADQNAKSSDADDRAKEIEASLFKLKAQMDMEVSALAERITKVEEERLPPIEEKLLAYDEQFKEVKETMNQTNISLEQAKVEAVAGDKAVDARLTTASAELNGAIEQLRDALSKSANAEEIEKMAEEVKRLDAQVRELRSNQGGQAQLRQMLDALSDKEASDAHRLTKEVNILQNRLGSFLDKGAASTVRCLSCFDRRSQLTNTIVVGSDGKTYLKSADGASVGKMNIPSPPVRNGSPSRTFTGKGSISPPPPMIRPSTSLPALN